MLRIHRNAYKRKLSILINEFEKKKEDTWILSDMYNFFEVMTDEEFESIKDRIEQFLLQEREKIK